MADETFDNLVVNNKLGIGTTEPAAQLHIAATEGISSEVFVASINGTVLKVTAEPVSASVGTATSHALNINTNGLPRIQISSEGNVGIGTDTTPANLQVKGNVTANAFSGNGTSLSGLVKQVGDTMTGPLTVQANLFVSGNVGIGTTGSSYKLAIAAGDINIDDGRALRQAGRWVIGGNLKVLSIGSSDKSDGRDIRFDPGFEGALTVKKDTGHVGIGTTNPSTKLEIAGTVRISEGNQSSFGGHLFLSKEDGNPGSGQWHINIAPNNALNFVETRIADYRLVINPGGNVGIGKANPACKLDVAGDLRADAIHSTGGFKFPDGTVQTTAIRIASGRVGFDKQSGVITNRKTVQFSGFNLNPAVLVALATIDADRNANLRIHSFVENITKNSCDICLSSWSDTTIWSAQVMWIAFGS